MISAHSHEMEGLAGERSTLATARADAAAPSLSYLCRFADCLLHHGSRRRERPSQAEGGSSGGEGVKAYDAA